jgi:serralysin
VADPGPSWHVIGTGDFNGDGKSDILLQNTDGQVSIWEMNGTNMIAHAPVADPGPSWHAIGTGASGSDILLQNTNGQSSIWEMNGTSIVGGAPVGTNPGPNWHTIALT